MHIYSALSHRSGKVGIKKKQLVVEAGDEGLTTAKQFYALAS